MANEMETFKQPFLGNVEDALDKACSITWDGCHKIYIALDMETHNDQIEIGYEMVTVENKADALNRLWDWWTNSCGLRFINSISARDTFGDVIPQFDYEEAK